MSLKRQHTMVSLFSMASMTDVIFLLLIFFMVTSTFVFPTALDITLPQGSEQVAIKPTTRVYVDSQGAIYLSLAGEEPAAVEPDQLLGLLQLDAANNPEQTIAVYADEEVPYGRVVSVLDVGAKNGLKMVLATRPAPASAVPQDAGATDSQQL